MAGTPVISLRLPPDLATDIAKRGEAERGDNRTFVVTRDLERLYALYQRAAFSLRGAFTVAEACLVCDCLNGSLMDANSASVLWAEVADGVQLNQMDAKWEVDGPALVAKLRGLNDLQALTIVDAAERFWASDLSQDERELAREVFGPMVST